MEVWGCDSVSKILDPPKYKGLSSGPLKSHKILDTTVHTYSHCLHLFLFACLFTLLFSLFWL